MGSDMNLGECGQGLKYGHTALTSIRRQSDDILKARIKSNNIIPEVSRQRDKYMSDVR